MNKNKHTIVNHTKKNNKCKFIIETIYNLEFYEYCNFDLKNFLKSNNKNKSIFIDGKYGSGKTEYIKWFMKKEKISYFYNELKTINFKRAIYINNSDKKHIILKVKNRLMNLKISNFISYKFESSVATALALMAILYQPIADFFVNLPLSIIFIIVSCIIFILWISVLMFFPSKVDKFLKKLTKSYKRSESVDQHEYSRKIIVIDDCNRYTDDEFHKVIRTYYQIFENDDEIKLIFIGTCKEANQDNVLKKYNIKNDSKNFENNICETLNSLWNTKYIGQTIVLRMNENVAIEILTEYIKNSTITIQPEWSMTKKFENLIKKIIKENTNEYIDMHVIIKIAENYLFILHDCGKFLSNEEILSFAGYLIKYDDRSSKDNFNDISILFNNNGFFHYYKNYAFSKTKNNTFEELRISDKQIFLAYDTDNFQKYFMIDQKINIEVKINDIFNAVLKSKFVENDKILLDYNCGWQTFFINNILKTFRDVISENSPSKFITNFDIQLIDANKLQLINNHWSTKVDIFDFLKLYENIYENEQQKLPIDKVLEILKIFNFDFENRVNELGYFYQIHILKEELQKMSKIDGDVFCDDITPLCKKVTDLLNTNNRNFKNNIELIKFRKLINKILNCK